MLKSIKKICPQCGNSNEPESNFCLKCGNKLTEADEKPILPNSGQFTDVLALMDLDDSERQIASNIIITTAGQFENTNLTELVYASEAGKAGESYKQVMEKLAMNLYRTAYSLGLDGICNLRISQTLLTIESLNDSHQIYAYGDGFKFK